MGNRTSTLWLLLLLAIVAGLQQGCSAPNKVAHPQGIVVSPNDSREYRHLRLTNNMDVLLISDPSSDKAAASLDVYVGSYQNPQDRAGLVHFLEHMLFLGTEKYPEPGEYQSFISEHGGSHNAGTGLENTNYFFDIDAAHLEPALDRFAQFFSAPNFDAKYVDRERNAVESEYRLKLRDDGRRGQDVLQEQVNPQHPLSKFTVGNLDTLADFDGRPLRPELLAIYQKYYSANIMKLVVLGNQSLDRLQAMVEPRFGPVVNNQVVVDAPAAPLFAADQLPMQLHIVPLQNSRSLSLNFPLPKMSPHWQKKPANYLAALLGHEGEGSLLEALKVRGWAEGLSAGTGLEDRGGALFYVDISLTPAGLAHQAEIVEMFFATVALIAQQGINKWRYREIAQLSEIAFQFQEKQNPMGYVSMLASKMQLYPVQDVLHANYVMNEFDAELLSSVAARLTPDNMLLSLTAPEVKTDKTSLMYQTPYAVAKIADADLAKWRSPGKFDDLTLPKANPYIPNDLSLLARKKNLQAPQLILDSKQVTAWHFPDTRFGVPKAHIIASLQTPGIDSPEAFAALELYLAYVNDQLSAAVYPAREAGLSFSLQPSERGIAIVVGGYSDKQAVLLGDILNALLNPDWDSARFERIQQTLARDMSNFAQQYPFRQVVASFNAVIKGQWTPLQKVDGVEQLSLSELKLFAGKLLESLELEVLISGNHDQASAMQLLSRLSSWTELQQTSVPQSVAKLAIGEQRVQVPVDHSDAALMLYLQGRDDSLTERAHMLLIGEMLASPFYTSLRTEKQLGYVVSAFASNHLRVPGLAMIVQSPSVDQATIKTEMTGFLAAFKDQVATLTDADLKRYKVSVLSGLEERPKNLGELNGRFMESLGLGYSAFDFRQQLSQEIASVTLESLSNAYDAVTTDQLRGLVVETVDADKASALVDLRRLGTVYGYEFR
ncbi:insulinase family protein [SAR92 clade bacterium H455]|uniref:Protease 3 n=1 Tax=SAR92 clade bacterium H455 TaxID=2974818 RepID=A0ABY5TJ48_9GAMM|nr:insulinase family protein [SAR92 clade bacterium H455]